MTHEHDKAAAELRSQVETSQISPATVGMFGAISIVDTRAHPVATTPSVAHPQMTAAQTAKKIQINKFFTHIVLGEQAAAEAMLKTDQTLATQKFDITDHAGRTFHRITGFQYALWALDWQMWEMIQPYLDSSQITEQIDTLEAVTTTGPVNHGPHFSCCELDKAYTDYLQNWQDWCRHKNWAAQEDSWRAIGLAQHRLPANLIQAYFHPRHSFAPMPDFHIPLQADMRADKSTWQDDTQPTILRGGRDPRKIATPLRRRHLYKRDNGATVNRELQQDAAAIHLLFATRKNQFKALKLAYVCPTRPCQPQTTVLPAVKPG